MKIRKLAAALCLLALLGLCGCGGSGRLEDYLQQHNVELESSSTDVETSPSDEVTSPADVSSSDVSGSDVSPSDATTTTTSTTASSAASSAAPVSSVLPEQFIGSWAVISVYQEAAASDISIEDALRREQMTGISFGSSSFDRAGESIHGAVFKVNTKATFADMKAFGITTEPLTGPFGSDAKITSVEVCTADGMTCTTVFLINDTTLIAFGSGMNVFTYEMMNAVG